MKKPVIGLALGSGAAKGWSQIGILEVLDAQGIKAEIVAGTSVGSFIGAAYASGKMAELHDWALSLRWRDVATMFDVSLDGGGLIEGSKILKQMDELGVAGPIEELPIPFAAVATDYLTGREAWFSSGEIKSAVRASIALPGVLSPHLIDDVWYVDGGLVNPVPISTCRALGADFIVAVNLNGDLVGRRSAPTREHPQSGLSDALEKSMAALPGSWREGAVKTVEEFLAPRPQKPGYFDILANSINIMQDKITRSRLAGEPPHVLITPRLGSMGIFDFDDAEAAIEEGRRCARHALPEIKYQLEHLSPVGTRS